MAAGGDQTQPSGTRRRAANRRRKAKEVAEAPAQAPAAGKPDRRPTGGVSARAQTDTKQAGTKPTGTKPAGTKQAGARPVGVPSGERHRAQAAGFWRLLRWACVTALLGPPLLILLFRFVPVPMTPLMVLRLAEGYGLHHEWAPYHRISPHLADAVIASEDNLFCREPVGFDWQALAGQLAIWGAGDHPRGASTITMQTARNLLLLPTRDIVRKALEAWLTPQLALLWPKARVMEVYLNIIEFGPGIYGADAAAMRFFGHHAATLSRDEAIRLALVLPSPLHWSAVHPSPALRERAGVISQRIGQLGPLLDCLR
jgi:monofunctional glycosyltransferase